MKLYLDKEEILDISELQIKVLEDEILSEEVINHIKHLMKYFIVHKYKSCLKKLKYDWTEKLRQKGLKSIPLDNDEFVKLVFSQDDYKNRSARDKKMPRTVVSKDKLIKENENKN